MWKKNVNETIVPQKWFMSFHVTLLQMLKLVGMRHCWQMVQTWTWWKCQLLTNLWNVETTQKKTFSHLSALANLPPTNASEKLLHIVGDLQIRQVVENVKMGWHAKLLANGWKMDMVKILKLVDMWDCWQIVEIWKLQKKRSLIAAANKVMTRTAGINYILFHFPQGKIAAAPIQTLHVSHCTPMTLELYDFYLRNLRQSLQKPTSILPPLMNGHSLLICRHVITLFATNPD